MASLTNIFLQWKRLFSDAKPRFIGTVSAVLPNDKYVVTFQAGGTLIASSSTSYIVGNFVVVEGTSIVQLADALPSSVYDI